MTAAGPLVKQFLSMARRESVHTVARRWVDLAYCAVAKPVNPARADALEAEYLTHARGQDAAELAAYRELLGTFIEAIIATDGTEDILGAAFGELGVLNAAQGQFFTPVHLCHMMAAITIPDDVASRHSGRIVIGDPACGTGAMVLAAFARCKTLAAPATFVVTDISRMIARAAYLQLTFAGVPATVHCGDSLRATVDESTITVAEFLSWDPTEKLDTRSQAGPVAPSWPPGQLSLSL